MHKLAVIDAPELIKTAKDISLEELFTFVKKDLGLDQNKILNEGTVLGYSKIVTARLENEIIDMNCGWKRIDMNSAIKPEDNLNEVTAWNVNLNNGFQTILIFDPYKMEIYSLEPASYTDEKDLAMVCRGYIKATHEYGNFNGLYSKINDFAFESTRKSARTWTTLMLPIVADAIATYQFFSKAAQDPLPNKEVALLATAFLMGYLLVTTTVAAAIGRYVLGPVVGKLASMIHENRSESQIIHEYHEIMPYNLWRKQEISLKTSLQTDKSALNYAARTTDSLRKRLRS